MIDKPLKLMNEDGTEFNPPKNPLEEKWDRLYPPMRYGEPCGPVLGYYEDGRPIMNYSCVLCHEEKCPISDSWKVPEEDREVYEAWRKEYSEYYHKHNPDFLPRVREKLKALKEEDHELLEESM